MRLAWQYVKRYKKILFSSLILAAINQIFSLLDPQIFRLLIDRYASRAAEINRADFLNGVLLLLLASVGVAFVSRVAKNFQDYFVNVIVQKSGTELYSQSVSHAFSLPYSAFEDQRSGELLSKLQKARTDTQALIKNSINVLFFSLVGVLFVLVYAFFVHWLVGLVYFLIIPILGFITFAISRGIKAAQAKVVKETANLAGSTTETLRNVELVKSLGLTEVEVQRLNTTNEKILQLELQKVRLVRKLSFIQGTAINALRSSLLLLMLWLIFTGRISLGEMFSLWIYSFFVFSPLAEFGDVVTSYQEARASLGQLEDIRKLAPEPKPDHPVKVDGLRSIEFKGVSFNYGEMNQSSAENVSFKINAGETVAFVGPSGSGKTTLVKLLVGLYRPIQGAVLFNGVDSRTIDLSELRNRIGFVAQETQLFAGTIRDNLLFVKPDAKDDDCYEVLKSAAALSILQRGGQGLETRIGEGGLKLSGGERQRLAIARALLRKPDLIIFDEATSSLDSITERSVTDTIRAIEKSRPGLITVLVAHRLSTVAHADRILVLERGRVIETGRHEELISKGGLYSALWREQVGAGSRPLVESVSRA